MNRVELNKIIEERYLKEDYYPIFISELVYPEVEELYLKTEKITKLQIAEFYQKYDYIGVRNALDIVNHEEKFHNEVVENVVLGKETEVSPSQFEYLKNNWVEC